GWICVGVDVVASFPSVSRGQLACDGGRLFTDDRCRGAFRCCTPPATARELKKERYVRTIPVLLGGFFLSALTPRVAAHFRLLEPASWIQESEELGDPQWSAPCGGTLKDPGKPTGAITKIRGGDQLHIRIREMAFHPGFYRVALAVNSR